MSKLSAKELANRGHMFLANGDKKSAAISQQQQRKESLRNFTSSKLAESFLSKFLKFIAADEVLVTICLEYLYQEQALREEGLFRVSGDSSIMKSLLSDFTSNRATKQFLR